MNALKLSDDYICRVRYIYNVYFYRFFLDELALRMTSTKERTHILHWCQDQEPDI